MNETPPPARPAAKVPTPAWPGEFLRVPPAAHRSPGFFAITVAHNESFFLPRWIAHHGRQLGLANLYVVDHGSTDGSTDALPPEVNRIRLPRTVHSDRQRSKFVSHLHAGLLQYHAGGFVTDCDEFLVADPALHGSLAAFAASVPGPAATPIGLDVWHMTDLDAPLDPAQPLLRQRRHCAFSRPMCKTAFARVSTLWGGGFHASTNRPAFVDGFYLLHMKDFDLEWRLERQAISRNYPWDGKYGGHSRGPDHVVRTRFRRIVAQRRLGTLPFDFAQARQALDGWGERNGALWYLRRPETPAMPLQGLHRVRELPDRFLDLF